MLYGTLPTIVTDMPTLDPKKDIGVGPPPPDIVTLKSEGCKVPPIVLTTTFKVLFHGALQIAVDPPLEPAHDHAQDPEPEETEDAVPALHNPDVGADERLAPLEDPQDPFVGLATVYGILPLPL
jgi:hypothetical protein